MWAVPVYSVRVILQKFVVPVLFEVLRPCIFIHGRSEEEGHLRKKNDILSISKATKAVDCCLPKIMEQNDCLFLED